jgi:uncharacterized protein YjiS (DUF1127 family)
MTIGPVEQEIGPMPEHPLSLRRTLDGTGHPAQRALSEIIAWLVRSLRAAAGSICRPRQSRALDNLSDHMLRDIGIESADAARESTVGFWRRR